ncbi:hypothetical protein FE257_003860 [Aspergillus nanangensis]|uniref:Uncharacterized protein n=1 Tax=Aspergillus nanangensis TaxID=2582783 RepID=A0AAD4CCA1_ASPNN|nr:hypothetical protein FE257_003860 [Aspergillus nanangensis]
MDWPDKVITIVEAAFDSILDKMSYPLEDSVHAPKKSQTTGYQPSLQASNMAPLANLDDAEGFMAAARALKLDPAKYMSPNMSPVAADDPAVTEDNDGATVFETSTNGIMHDSVEVGDYGFSGPGVGANGCGDAASQNNAEPATVVKPPVENTEDREHMVTFQTWGPPETRTKPASRVRRVILKNLPSPWCTPSKALSLIHGGLVESIRISQTGAAHVLFCDADACQAFYDKYPNGIDLDKEKKITVFVEMGDEVDVLSSYLSFVLSVGATRAVRAVGVSMDISMAAMVQLGSGNNRKIEKIIDTYIPGDARSVIFRFTNVEDAVAFRSVVIRDEQWEQCNVQYSTDPCEIANGVHAD